MLVNESVKSVNVDVPSIRHISPYHQRYFLLLQFLDRNLQRIRLPLQIDQYRRIHTTAPEIISTAIYSTDAIFENADLSGRETT